MGNFKKRHNEGCSCFNCRTPDDDENLPILPPSTVLLDSKLTKKKKKSKKAISKRNVLKIRLRDQLLDLCHVPVPINYAIKKLSEKLQIICPDNNIPLKCLGRKKKIKRFIRTSKFRFLKTHLTSVLKIKRINGKWTCCQNRFDRANLKKFFINLNLSPYELFPFAPIVLPLDCSFDSLSYCQPNHFLKSQINQDLNLSKSTKIKEPDNYIDISSPLSITISSEEDSQDENEPDIYEVNLNSYNETSQDEVIKTHLKNNKTVELVDKSSMADLTINEEKVPLTSTQVLKTSKEKVPSTSVPVLKTSKKKVPSPSTHVLNICKEKEPLASVPVSEISNEKEPVPVSKVTKKKKKKLKKKVPLNSTSLEKISKENEPSPLKPVEVLKLIFSKVKVPSTSAPELAASEENEPIISRPVLRTRKAKLPSTSTPVILKNSKEKAGASSKIDINKLPSCYVLLKRLKASELQKYSKENQSIRNKKPLDPRSFVYGAELIKKPRRCPLVISSNSDSDSYDDDNMSFSHDRDMIESDDSEVEIIDEDESSECKIKIPLIITIKEEPTEKERELKLNRIKFTDLMMGHLAYDFCPLSQGVSMLSTKLGWDLFPFGAKILNKNKITREQLKDPNAGEWLQLKTQFVLNHFQEAFCIRETTPNKYICCKNRVEFLDCKAFLNLFWNIRIR